MLVTPVLDGDGKSFRKRLVMEQVPSCLPILFLNALAPTFLKYAEVDCPTSDRRLFRASIFSVVTVAITPTI